MIKTHELKMAKHDLISEQKKILDKADTEKRSMTSSESREFERLDKEIDALDLRVIAAESDNERRQKLAEREIATLKKGEKLSGNDSEFRNIGEMFHAVVKHKRDGVNDPRLDELREKREQTMGTGATGGYAIPEQFDAAVKQVQSQQGIVRSRARVIPAGSPPDAKLTFPALDQTATSNMYGGVLLYHTGEGVTMTETETNLREVTLEPKEISAYIVVTQKLLNNWSAAGAFLSGLLAQAMTGQEDYDFMRGDGVNKALGFINSAAAIAYTRAGANAISFPDTYGMMSRILMRGSGSYCWLASQTIIPQLAAMVDAGGHAVWLGSSADNLKGAAGPLPGTLLGLPLIFADRLPALGTKGDLSLVDLSYYLIKDGSGPAIASSEHVFFTSNKVVLKIVWNVDAHPWLTEPLALEGSSGDTVSPFVVLT